MVEFALILPVALLLVALISTAGQMIITGIEVTQAARAAAVTAAADDAQGTGVVTQTTDAAQSANDEEGGAGSIHCSGTGVPTGCVEVTDLPAGSATLENSEVNLVQVNVWQKIDPFIPLLPPLNVSSEATAPW
jgi:Flp pilus assembly protein TadG